MISKRIESSGNVKIFIAGCVLTATQICQKWVERGACVNVVETNYIYKYGAEKGVIVEFINYPRFPKLPSRIQENAKDLAIELLNGLSAGSMTIVSSGWYDPKHNHSTFYDRREQND